MQADKQRWNFFTAFNRVEGGENILGKKDKHSEPQE